MSRYIHNQIMQARNHSDGVLTLDAERALAKLGSPTLPQSRFWLLKVVQAAVAGRAPELLVDTFGSEISCSFRPEMDGTEESDFKIFEAAPVGGCWSHLRQALWALMSQQLEFECGLPGPSRTWRYSRGQLGLLRGSRQSELHLTVSSGATGELLELLSERAFLCPIPILVNGCRLERIATPTTVTAAIHQEVVHDLELPDLMLPSCRTEQPKPSKALGVVSVHLEQGKRGWRPLAAHSFVYWFLDGVWIERQRLPFDRRSISCEVYASADGLKTDASGLQLTRDKDQVSRYRRCLAVAGSIIQNTRLPRELVGSRQSTAPRHSLLGAVTLGLVLILAPPSAATWLATGGIVAALYSIPSNRQVIRELQNSLEGLQIQAARSGAWP